MTIFSRSAPRGHLRQRPGWSGVLAAMDDLLRDLDRAVQQGDAQAAVGLLRARVRRGELDEERLRLAAHLGDGAAIACLGGAVAATSARCAGDLVLGLKPFGPAAFSRAGVTALRLLSPTPSHVVQAIEAWLECPCDDHARAVRAAARDAELGHWDPNHVGPAAFAARLAATAPRARRGCEVEYDDEGRAVGWWCYRRQPRGRYLSVVSGDEEAASAIRTALLSWCSSSSPS